MKTITRHSVKVIFKLFQCELWLQNIYHVSFGSRSSNWALKGLKEEKEKEDKWESCRRICRGSTEGEGRRDEGKWGGLFEGNQQRYKDRLCSVSDSEQEITLCLSFLLATLWVYTTKTRDNLVIDTQCPPIKTHLCCVWCEQIFVMILSLMEIFSASYCFLLFFTYCVRVATIKQWQPDINFVDNLLSVLCQYLWKNAKILGFLFLKFEHFLVLFIYYGSKLDMFGLWTAGWTRQDILGLYSELCDGHIYHFIGQII